jgi:hypothetical protein
LADLPIEDLARIGLTPDLKDLLGEDGREQIKDILERLVDDYSEDARKEIEELLRELDELADRLKDEVEDRIDDLEDKMDDLVDELSCRLFGDCDQPRHRLHVDATRQAGTGRDAGHEREALPVGFDELADRRVGRDPGRPP